MCLYSQVFENSIKSKEIFVNCGSRDIDECSLNLHNCKYPSQCQNMHEGFVCVCPENLVLDQYGYCTEEKNCNAMTNGTFLYIAIFSHNTNLRTI